MTLTAFMGTTRQAIIEALRTGMLTSKDISKMVGIKEKEVLEHLPHVVRSVQHMTEPTGGRHLAFVVEHPECLSCGFAFKKRDRLKTPGRCPICRSEEIRETRFGIVEE